LNHEKVQKQAAMLQGGGTQQKIPLPIAIARDRKNVIDIQPQSSQQQLPASASTSFAALNSELNTK
jgi:hypothetical protein